LVIPPPALHAKLAQLDTLLTPKEMDVWDQSQLATASKDTQLMDTNASTVNKVKLLCQTTTSNVCKHQHVTETTNTV
jgi:capsular polysaccharide biosynthesis protein